MKDENAEVKNINPNQNQMAIWLRELADDMQSGKIAGIAVAAVFEQEEAERRNAASTTLQMAGQNHYTELCLIGEIEHCKARLLGVVLHEDLEEIDNGD